MFLFKDDGSKQERKAQNKCATRLPLPVEETIE